jgi:phage gp46-like protein
MGGLLIGWDAVNSRADWLRPSDPAYATSGPLQTAVIVMLFTDRVVGPDQVPEDGTGDRRGWWADSYIGTPIGSRLWTLRRAVKSDGNAILKLAQSYVDEALAPLVTQGVAQTVTCAASWLDRTFLLLNIVIAKPNGTATRFQFATPWAAV